MAEWNKTDMKFSKIEDIKYYEKDKLMDEWYKSPFICPKCKKSIYTLITTAGGYPACKINNMAYYMAQSLYVCLECKKLFVPIGGDLTAETILCKDMED